jgi:hypothetical protein
MWLASVLDSVPGQSWTHESRTVWTGKPWQVLDGLPVDSHVFDSYWHDVRRRMLACDIVGDSNSWPPELLPAVDGIIPIDRVIYLTRNKERQAHSLMTKSPVWSNPPYPAVAHERLKLYGRISGLPVDTDLLVQANDFMPDWLRSKGLTVDVYSLEELTTDHTKLRELAPLTDVELVGWQQQNINRKVFGAAV